MEKEKLVFSLTSLPSFQMQMVPCKTVSGSVVALPKLCFQNYDNETLLIKKFLIPLFHSVKEGAHANPWSCSGLKEKSAQQKILGHAGPHT